MFTEKEQIQILEHPRYKKLGYVIKKYNVAERLGHNAMIKRRYGYEVFKDDALVGKVDDVFKKLLIEQIFNIEL